MLNVTPESNGQTQATLADSCQVKYTTREQYLLAAVELLTPIFTRAGATVPKVHVSTGWPSVKAVSAKSWRIGECWDKAASADEVHQIFISPYLADPLHINPGDGQGVLPTLAHEVVHAIVGIKAGHKAPFKKVAVAIGLDGKMTSTFAGEALLKELDAILPALGKYPHAKLDALKSGKKKQTTRMVKCECGTCGYILRTSRKWIDLGTPSCPCGHGKMDVEIPEGGESDESED